MTAPVAQNTRSVINPNVPHIVRGVPKFDQQRLSAVQREPKTLPVIRVKEGQQFAGQRMPQQEPNQKPMMPMLMKVGQTASTIEPMLTHEYIAKPNFATRSRPVMRVPKMEVEPKSNFTEPSPRIQSIGFNWPKARKASESQENSTQAHESNINSSNQLRALIDVNTNRRQQVRDQNQKQIVTDRRNYGESQQNIKYDVTESPYQTTVSTELYKETDPPTTVSPTVIATTVPVDSYTEAQYISAKEPSVETEFRSEKNESLSSVDSEVNYQTQFYDPEKPMSHFEPSYQTDQVSSYDSPIQSQNVAVPENEVSYDNPEPEPESLSLGTPDGAYYDENEKGSSEENGPKLRILLEQFIQQLDILKYVAAKELQKSDVPEEYTNSNYESAKDGEVIKTTVAEPSISRTGTTYDDYQNQRSFEQNYSNSDSKAYKDTNEKRYGRYDQNNQNVQGHYQYPSNKCKTKLYGLPKPLHLSTADSIPQLNYKPRHSPKETDSSDTIVSDVTLSID